MHIHEVVVTGPNQVELQSRELAEDLGPHEILIETEYTFISAGTELANYTGREPKVFQPGAWCAYPWRSGYAHVGLVRAIGERVSRAEVGQRVFTYGNHASAVRYNETRLVTPVPEDIDPGIAAAARMAGVSLTALIVSEIKDDPWVVIFGLGMVGILAAQMFTARGCRVIGVDPVEMRRDLGQRCGLEYTVGGAPAEVQQAISELTGGHLADISVDAVGHSAVVRQALQATASFGQLILLGSPRVAVEGNLTELLSDIHLRWITMRGALEWCVPMYPQLGKPESQYSKQQQIYNWIRRGLLHFEPLISHRLPPQQIEQAYNGLRDEPNTYTGVLLTWK